MPDQDPFDQRLLTDDPPPRPKRPKTEEPTMRKLKVKRPMRRRVLEEEPVRIPRKKLKGAPRPGRTLREPAGEPNHPMPKSGSLRQIAPFFEKFCG